MTQANSLAVPRITAALDALPAGCDAEAVVAAMREGLRSFVGAAEPSDDLTLLVLQRR
jgi:serine phosphatase RsbU (regulator of sigma subunit)